MTAMGGRIFGAAVALVTERGFAAAAAHADQMIPHWLTASVSSPAPGIDLARRPWHPCCLRKKGVSMNKSDLVAKVAELSGLAKGDADKAVDAVLAAITGALKSGDDVRLVGFGNFSVSARPAREGKNPRTGEKLAIPASKAPKFSPGKGLKDAVNG